MGRLPPSSRSVTKLIALILLLGAGFAASNGLAREIIITTTTASSTTPTSTTANESTTSESTTSESTTTGPPQEPCSVKVNKVDRFDFSTGKFVPYAGETLRVMPFEVIKLRYDLTVDIPAKHTVTFFASLGQLKRLLSFDPGSVDGPKVASGQIVTVNIKVPEAQQDGSPTVGNTFANELNWHCENKKAEVASGKLGTLTFSVVAGPKPGGIRGKVTEARPPGAEGPPKPATECLITLFLNGGLVGKTFTDEDGVYTFAQLLPGTYRVEVTGLCGKGKEQKEVYATQSKPAVVKSEQTTSVDFTVTKPKGK